MKVLQINAVYGFKSTGEIVKDIGNTRIKDGGEAYFAYQSTNVDLENGYKVGNKLDWKWHALHARIFGKQAYASKRATKKLLKWIDKVKPDVVHFHNIHSNFINLKILCSYLAKKNIATVVSLHDCGYFKGKCTHFIAIGCEKWKTTCGNCPLLKKLQPSMFFDPTKKVLKQRTDYVSQIENLLIVPSSGWVKSQLEMSVLGVKAYGKIYNGAVYNGVDTKIFCPHENLFRQENGIKDEFVILGFADKWTNSKNKEVVEKLFATYTDCKFVIVGCEDEAKQYFSSFSNVVPMGYVRDRQKLSDIYASANVFVNLTRADTLPTVNMESVCCGTPVITYNCGGSPELVDKECGFIVEIDDFIGLVQSIDKIKNNPLEFDVSIQHAKFDKNECYKKYLDIYKGLCKNK